MKILFITSALGIDYLSDCIFHGLVTLGHTVTDSKYLWYLSKPITKQQQLKLYGKGFTLSGILSDRSNIDRTNIEERIRNKQFDCIIYGSIHRCNDYLDTIIKYYTNKEVIFIDGEDAPQFSHVDILTELLDKGIYFKRELYNNKALPISFSIPKQKILTNLIEKTLNIATIIPGNINTYIYTNQYDYYMGYAKSKFGLTWKKAGWDCMRHYEIIANNCLPYFKNFQQCPKYCMVNWPVELQLEANNMIDTNNLTNYNKILQLFFNYCKQQLTTQQSAKYILNKLY